MPMLPPQIRFKDFCLRAWRQSDAAARARHGSDPGIARYMFDWFGYPHSIEAASRFITEALQTEKDLLYCISVEGEAVGSISLNLGQDVERFSAEVGYWLSREYWGRGIMTRALKAVKQAGVTEYGLHRIYATVEPDNQASALVLQSAGFSLEGRLKHAVYRDGNYMDHLIYGYVAGA